MVNSKPAKRKPTTTKAVRSAGITQPMPTAFVSSNEANPLGGASKTQLAAVAIQQLGADPDLETSEAILAIESLARNVVERLTNPQAVSDPQKLAIFLVSDRARQAASTNGAAKEPIIDNGSTTLTGKLWFTGPNFASGYSRPFVSDSSAGIFDEVIALGFGSHRALVYDPTATEAEIRVYPNGLSDDAAVQRFAIASASFSLAALDEVLKRHHEQSIITPDAALPDFNPWNDPNKYIPRPNAERFFQGMLKLVLDVAFGPKVRVAFEVRGTEGRCDLLISSLVGSNRWNSHAALELKVLRSFTAGGSAVSGPSRAKAVSDGLLQAIAYRNENRAKNGLLCCFDMRRPLHCDGMAYLKPITRKAKKEKIHLRSFRIYGSSDDLRSDRYGSATGAAKHQ